MGKVSEMPVEDIKEVARLSLEIEKKYDMPMDIEWGIANGKVFIFQARPITVNIRP